MCIYGNDVVPKLIFLETKVQHKYLLFLIANLLAPLQLKASLRKHPVSYLASATLIVLRDSLNHFYSVINRAPPKARRIGTRHRLLDVCWLWYTGCHWRWLCFKLCPLSELSTPSWVEKSIKWNSERMRWPEIPVLCAEDEWNTGSARPANIISASAACWPFTGCASPTPVRCAGRTSSTTWWVYYCTYSSSSSNSRTPPQRKRNNGIKIVFFT